MKTTFFLVLCFIVYVQTSQVEISDLGEQVVHNNNTTPKITKNFHGETLAFVTPWNGHGYNVVKSPKFDYVSPVWLQIRPNIARASKNKFIITGQHDIDSNWVNTIHEGGGEVLPRLQFDWAHWKEDDIKLFFKSTLDDNLHMVLIESIIDLVNTRQFDGIVLEWGFMNTSQIIHIMKPFLRELYQRLHFNRVTKQLFLVIPPYRGNPQQQTFNAQHYTDLIDVVDRFCVMTYDYSNGRPGPNAPLNDFVIPTIDYFVNIKGSSEEDKEDRAGKLLLGLNFYGYDYRFTQQKIEPIIGKTYKEIMIKYKPKLNWDEQSAEHYFDFVDENGQHRVFYPSVKSIRARLEVANKKKLAGIMIWEAGQGIDEFLSEL